MHADVGMLADLEGAWRRSRTSHPAESLWFWKRTFVREVVHDCYT